MSAAAGGRGAAALLIHSAQQIVQVVGKGERLVTGKCLDQVALLNKSDASTGLSIVLNSDGSIGDLGTDEEIAQIYADVEFEKKIDAAGKCILPGLVDAHTHSVWAGDRVKEFSMKLSGSTYMEIHGQGGGIYSTVAATRAASEPHLLHLLLGRLRGMLGCGTTLLEAKSGYGLPDDTHTEMKMLRVLERAKGEQPIEIATTFCGAHALPRHLSSEEATDLVLHHQLPALSKLMSCGEVRVENIDVFCERGVFDIDQSRRILEAGQQMGLNVNFHGDELHPMGAAKMGAELGARAISHLEEISGEGIEAMSRSGTIAIILPTTAHVLRLRPPPVPAMMEGGVAIALGSDFNPNAFCYSMPLVMHLACVTCGMSMEQALHAATINAAAALGRANTHGSIEKGKTADLLIINAPRWEHLIYQMGSSSSLIERVIKRGRVVYENTSSSSLI